MNMAHNSPMILVVEDDKYLSVINCRALDREGYTAVPAYSLAEARDILASTPRPFDIILLDVKLPDGSGFDLCREIRPNTNAHIIFVTSVTEMQGEFDGLQAGGDDYLRKPYDITLLRQRIKNVLERRVLMHEESVNKEQTRQEPGRIIETDSFTIDILKNQFITKEKAITLSPLEVSVLVHFAEKGYGNLVTTEFLLMEMRGGDTTQDSQAVRQSISRLRGKLAGSGYTIVYDKLDKGYRFEEE